MPASFLLRTLSVSYVRRHLGKTGLTLLAVTVGVATFSSMRSSRGALVDGLRSTVDLVAGRAQLQVTGVGGVPEQLQDVIRDVTGVRAVAPVIEQIVSAGGESLLVVGVDLVGDREMRDYAFDGEDADLDDPLLFLARPDSIALSRDVAGRIGVRKGDPLSLAVGDQQTPAVVRSLLRVEGFAEAFGGNLAVTDVYAAQDLFGRGRRFDHIDVRLEDGAPVEAAASRLREAVGPGYEVETPERRGVNMERLIANFTTTLDVSCTVALAIGAFLVSNAFGVAVNRRRRDIGVLRAVGATARQVQLLFLSEAVVLGLVGSALGLALGAAVADQLLLFIESSVETGWGIVGANARRVVVDTPLVLQCVGMGVAASIVGAWVPARAAARMSPVEALTAARSMSVPPGRFIGRTLGGVAFLALAVAAGIRPPAGGLFVIPGVLVLGGLGTLLLTGPLAAAMIARAAPLIARLSPVSGQLAADALSGHLRRASSTTAAMTLSIAFVIGTAGYFESLAHALHAWTARIITSDVVVRASTRLGPSSLRFAPELIDDIRAMPEVRSVEGFRVDRVDFRGEAVTMVAIDSEGLRNRVDQEFVAGDPRGFLRGLIDEGQCAVSDNFARRFGLGVGDVVELGSPSGPIRLPIVAVITSFFSDRGAIMIDRAMFDSHWRDGRVDMIHVNLNADVDPRSARALLRQRLKGRVPAIISTRDEFLTEVRSVLDRFNTLTRVAVLMGLLVAYMGVVTSLLISVAERTREIGILKALGALGYQIRRSVVFEALATTGCATAIALPLAALLARFLETSVMEIYAGFRLSSAVPAGMLAQLSIALPIVSILAAWIPARHAAATNTVEAISYD